MQLIATTSMLISLFLLASPSALATLGHLSMELIGEGLISIDENGIPTTECMVYKNGTSKAETCKMTEGFGHRSVGCFTLYKLDGFIQQGCYSSQDLAMRDQCRKRTCRVGGRKGPVSFCCCHGALCNADLVQ